MEQASARADALAAQASSARKDAEDAKRRADQLDIEAGSARTEANRIAMANSSAQGFQQMEKKLDVQFDHLIRAVGASPGNGGVFGKDGKLASASPARVGQLVDTRS